MLRTFRRLTHFGGLCNVNLEDLLGPLGYAGERRVMRQIFLTTAVLALGLGHCIPAGAIISAANTNAACNTDLLSHQAESLPMMPVELASEQRAPLPDNRATPAFCVNKTFGAYPDPTSLNCFFWCYGEKYPGASSADDLGYRSCCAAGVCYQSPSLRYPGGACMPCPAPPPPPSRSPKPPPPRSASPFSQPLV